MLSRFFGHNRLLAPIDGDGAGDGGGGAGDGGAPSLSPFDQAMRNVGAEATAQLAANGQDTPTPEPTTPPAGAAPPVQAPAGGAPGAAPPAAAAQQFLTLEQGRALAQQWQLQQQNLAALQQMIARGQTPQPAAAEPAKPTLARPTSLDLLKTFREPMPQQGETREQFEQRRTALVLDHINHGVAEYAEKYAQQQIDQRFERYQQEQVAAQQRAEGERRYHSTLDDAVTRGGFAAGTPVAQYVRDVAHNAIVSRVNRGERFNDATLTQAMTQEIARAKQFLGAPAAAPAPAAAAPAAAQPAAAAGAQPRAPNGQFVPKDTQSSATTPAAPPISGAGGMGANAAPPNGAAPKAKSFDESMRNVFGHVSRALGDA